MDFALNYSPQAARLIESGEVDIDTFKCPDWEGLITEAQRSRPVYVHFPLQLGRGEFETSDWTRIDELLWWTRTSFVNVHLNPNPEWFAALDGRGDARASLVTALVDELAPVCDRYGPDRVLLENIIYRPDSGDHARLATDPEVISEVVRNSGCGLLLDLSHARISAHNHGLTGHAYLAGFPLERLRELHLTGIDIVDGQHRDHMEFSDADWQATTWALEAIRSGAWPAPSTVTLEYGGVGPAFAWRSDVEAIRRHAPRLRAMLVDIKAPTPVIA